MGNFAFADVAGYIASRHLQAIRATGNEVVVAIDPHDEYVLERHACQPRAGQLVGVLESKRH